MQMDTSLFLEEECNFERVLLESSFPRLSVLTLGPQEVCPPTDGGKEGIHGALAALARIADVTYACPVSTDRTTSSAAYSEIGVEYIPVDYVPKDSAAVILSASMRLKPYKFYKYGSPHVAQKFSESIGLREFDAILCFHAHTEDLGQRLKRLRQWRCPVVVREHNIEYELVASYKNSLPALARFAAWPFEWMTRREEQRIWSRADAVAFLSDRDLATARATGVPGNLVLAPEGVPIPPKRAPQWSSEKVQLLLPLNQRATQSVANLRQFLRTHWAHAHFSLPDVRLAVTGVSLDRLSELMSFSRQALTEMNVHALGFLPSLNEAFADSLALVSPAFIGGGIRKKVLEGMANELPVIATDLDIQTCSFFKPPENILRMGTPEEFVVAVKTLRNSPSIWEGVASAGRRTVEQYASWDGFAKVIVDELQDLVHKYKN